MAAAVRAVIDHVLRETHADPYGNLFADGTRERLAKLLSPRYLKNKIRVLLYERRNPGYPWLTRDAIELLERHLDPTQLGFEWGSGNGSRWFAQRCATLVSVEHNPAWFERVRAQLEASGLRNVDYRLVDEARYTSVIEEFPDAHFDFVLVDGLFRDVAFLASVSKLKPDGWLIFDNANWYMPSESRTPHSRSDEDGPATPGFARAAEQVRAWEVRWTTNGVNDTAIYIKPALSCAA